MDTRLRQISRLLKRYDSDLFPKRALDGSLGIMRKRRGFDLFRFQEFSLWMAKDWDDLVIPCTDTWVVTGTPVDWGIEPILNQVQKTDSWRNDGDYERFCKARERRTEDEKRQKKNEIRAIAADLRTEFAKAVNDINTSILEKVESRRNNVNHRT